MLKGIIKHTGEIVFLEESNKKAVGEAAWFFGFVIGVNEAGLRIVPDPEIPSGERILDVQNTEPAEQEQIDQELQAVEDQEQPADRPKIDPATGIKA